MTDTEIITRDQNTMPVNPFAQEPRGRSLTATAAAAAEEHRAIAEIQSSLVVARRYGRDIAEATQRIGKACERPELAELALYRYPRGGEMVEGESIRLMEEIARQWGNISYGFRVLDEDEDRSHIEAYAWDLETNTRVSRLFHVDHMIHKKGGQVRHLKDPRDIYEHISNFAQRRVRACLIAAIPRMVTDYAVEMCRHTMETMSGDKLSQSLLKMVNFYGQVLGISQDTLEKKLGHPVDETNAKEVSELRKLGAAIRDGFAKPYDYFDVPKPEDATENTETSPIERIVEQAEQAIGERQTQQTRTDEPQTDGPLAQQILGIADGASQPEWPKVLETGEEVDKNGEVWNETEHSAGKTLNADGTWRKRRHTKPAPKKEAPADSGEDSEKTGDADGHAWVNPTPERWVDVPGRIFACQTLENLEIEEKILQNPHCPEDIREKGQRAAEKQRAFLAEKLSQ